MGRHKDAITEFKEAVAVDTEYVMANYGIGMAYSSKVSYERKFHPMVHALYHRPELSESVPDTLRLKVSHDEISRQCEILVGRTS